MYFVENQGADLLNEVIALRVMAESGIDAPHLHCMLEASKCRQIIMVKTEKDEPLASLAFAKISKFTLNLLVKNPEHKLLSYEYSEGKILYVLDGFFRKNCFKVSINLLLPKLKRYRLIAYVNRGRLRVFYNNNGSISLLRLKVRSVE
jgi:hypothetical protein